MNDFLYYAPTKVYFGRNAIKNIAPYIRDYGAKRVLIHYGGGSARRSGLLDKIEAALTEAGIAWVSLGGVEPNPKLALVHKGIDFCKAEGVDFILAVGGGSVIDSAKSMALGVANGCDPWRFTMREAVPTCSLPVAAVLTIAAAGSEMSNSHVISNPAIPLKKGLGSDITRCVAAFLDPTLTYTVSAAQTAYGTVDIMMHTMERYFTEDESTMLTDKLAEGLLSSVIAAGAAAIKNPEDYEARATLMWASSLSHNGLTGCMKTVPCMTVHQLEHGVSAVYDHVAHGAGLAVLYPAWAEYIYKLAPKRFAAMARNVWGVENTGDDEADALAGIRAMKAYFVSIGAPVSFTELGIGEDAFETIANNITANGKNTIWSLKPLGNPEILEIFRLAL